MQTPRKEPVIDRNAFELTDRVRLTWHDVRELARETAHVADDPVEPVLASAPAEVEVPVPTPVAVPAAPVVTGLQTLDAELVAAVAAAVAPGVEKAVREALRSTLELSLSNALSRARADLDRSVTGIVSAAVTEELSHLDLSKIHRG